VNNQSTNSAESTADREFVHSRLIDAPRERVFKAFAEPTHLARWWGPNGFTSTFLTFDLFDTADHKERIAGFVADANEQNLNRLANEVLNVK
jgi:uncharacterized protein YndB with AHSA1/START domain